MNKYVPPTKEFLIEEYVNKDKSIKAISDESGFTVGTIFNYLKRYEIPRRHGMTEDGKKRIRIANSTNIHKGWHLSEKTKEKMRKARQGKYSKPSQFGGHRKKRSDGYIKVYCPDHPMSSKDGYVMEHILVMESQIGRYITRDEVVHHKNHIRDDNRIENLELMTFKEHAGLHMKERWAKKKGVMTYQ